MYTQEHIQKITTKRIVSFDGLVLQTRGIWVLMRDGVLRRDFNGNLGMQNWDGADVSVSGHLMHPKEYEEFVCLCTEVFGYPHAVPASSGAMANEFAVKLAYTKQGKPKNPTIAVFECAFHGRTSLMEALSGLSVAPFINQKEIIRIPFYDPNDPKKSLIALRRALKRKHRPICFITELFQGEGGFNYAPADFFVPLFELCKKYEVSVIADEVQTSCRTARPLLTIAYDLRHLVDIVTIGKLTHTAAILFEEGYDADDAHVSQTFAGSVQDGAQILRKLQTGGYWGENGKIMRLSMELARQFATLQTRNADVVLEHIVIGAMAALRLAGFEKKEVAQTFVDCLFANNILATTCGREPNPYKIRFYFPFNITANQLDCAFADMEQAIQAFRNRS